MSNEPFHEIWHGDSRELCAFLPEGGVDCVITDPPFGVNNKSNMATTAEGRAYARKIANDETPEQAISVFTEVMDVLLPKTKPDSDLYIFTAWNVLRDWLNVAEGLERHGFFYKNLLVWEKDGASMGDTNAWGTSYEFIIFLKKGKRERSDQRRPSVIHASPIASTRLIHPHEKPSSLLEKLIKHSTSPGDLVVDPFGGSGSLVRAARGCGRNGLAIEYDKINHEKALRALNETEDLFA